MSNNLQDRIDRIQRLFGYPFPPLLRQHVEREVDSDDKPAEEIDGTFVGGIIHWTGEFCDGPDPGIAAVEALFARLKRPVPPAAKQPKPANQLARHFSGLIELASEWVRTPQGMQASVYWIADVNPRQDREQCPVYRFTPGQPVGSYLFQDPKEFDEWQAAIEAIESLDEEVEEEQKPGLLKRLREKFPVAVAVEHVSLIKRGILPAGDKAQSIPAIADPESQRLGTALMAFEAIAEVLIARAGGKESTLSTSARDQALAAAGAETTWPPALMLRMQAHALSGGMSQASAEARRILDGHLGVPLTERWADRIVRGLSPYDR